MREMISVVYGEEKQPVFSFTGFSDKSDGSTDANVRFDDDFLNEARLDMTQEEIASFVEEILQEAVEKKNGYRLLIELES